MRVTASYKARQAQQTAGHVYLREEDELSMDFLRQMLLYDVLILCEESGFGTWSKVLS